MSERWLIDKSALVRLELATNYPEWESRIERGLVAVTTVTLLELGYSARNLNEWRRFTDGVPVDKMVLEYFTPLVEVRALEVQGLLAERGQHRSASIPDLLIAATAEKSKRTLLHLDKDFELIAEITGQPVERISVD